MNKYIVIFLLGACVFNSYGNEAPTDAAIQINNTVTRIIPWHVRKAMENDEELNRLLNEIRKQPANEDVNNE